MMYLASIILRFRKAEIELKLNITEDLDDLVNRMQANEGDGGRWGEDGGERLCHADWQPPGENVQEVKTLLYFHSSLVFRDILMWSLYQQ